jgi:leader peptidase (prepilin peptidase) / N-methyltransferase
VTDMWIAVYLTVFGAALGSFLNVAIARWPAEESVIRPRSRCPGCGTPIAWYDNIPIVSWLVLRGRCRACRQPISVRYPLVELAVAAIWLGMVLWQGPGLEAVRGATFFTLLLGIGIIDLMHRVIPDQLSVVGAALGLAMAAPSGGFPFLAALVGAGAAYGLMWLVKWGAEAVFRKPALGVGDIHMMAMIGAFLGLAGALLTVLLGSILGLLIGVPLAWFRGKLEAMGTYLPLGTFLALGAAITYIWGDALIDWYLRIAMPI